MAEDAEMSLGLLSHQTDQERSQQQDQTTDELQSSVEYELVSQSDVQHQPDIRDININKWHAQYFTNLYRTANNFFQNSFWKFKAHVKCINYVQIII